MPNRQRDPSDGMMDTFVDVVVAQTEAQTKLLARMESFHELVLEMKGTLNNDTNGRILAVERELSEIKGLLKSWDLVKEMTQRLDHFTDANHPLSVEAARLRQAMEAKVDLAKVNADVSKAWYSSLTSIATKIQETVATPAVETGMKVILFLLLGSAAMPYSCQAIQVGLTPKAEPLGTQAPSEAPKATTPVTPPAEAPHAP